MSAHLIQSLIPYLPRYAEEEGDFYSVSREGLINAVCQQHQLDRAIVENTIDLVENLLDTLAVLNPVYLQKDEWRFVSFPAQLMATSVLTALGDTESRLFAPNFWNTQGVSNDKKNQQRDVLSFIENSRFDHHASKNAQPIRYIHVAWGIIKIEGKILFYQREDTQKRHEKSAGDYGLIGGRANQDDVPIVDKSVLLKELQSPNSGVIKSALPETLKRELREEAELLFETHYTFKLWRSLKPYRQVQGAAPNHALTEYYLDIFQIDLTLEGYLFLLQRIKTDESLVWFSIADMAHGETTDGKIAYIKAMYDDFGNDRSALEATLAALTDSFASRYLIERDKYGVTLPVVPDKLVLAGMLGKAKPLNLCLEARELAVLLALAAHLRNFEFEAVEEKIVLHPYGWIDVSNDSTLQSELRDLAVKLRDTDLIIESHRDVFFRLSINPELVFFEDGLFSYALIRDDMDGFQIISPTLTIYRQSFDTALGRVKGKSEIFMLPQKFAHKLELLAVKPVCESESKKYDVAVKIEDNYKKGLHKDPKFLALGLRGLIRRDAGMIKFVLSYSII